METYALHAGAGGCSSCKEPKQTKITDGSAASMFTVLFCFFVLYSINVEDKVLCIKDTQLAY
jgi:hypothetical protein